MNAPQPTHAAPDQALPPGPSAPNPHFAPPGRYQIDEDQPATASPTVSDEARSQAGLQPSAEAQERIARYCQQTFTSPELTAVGSEALINAFSVNLNWLSDLIQPPQLIAELNQACCQLTCKIILYWDSQGQTHKLAHLADAILECVPPLHSPEAGRAILLLAGMLGILRPERARRLHELGVPLLARTEADALSMEALRWIEAGEMLDTISPVERALWNERLRHPDNTWEWESPEALNALRQLANKVRQDDQDFTLFQKAVPTAWWELATRSSRHSVSSDAPPSDLLPSRSFGSGILLGIGFSILAAVGWLATQAGPKMEIWAPSFLKESTTAATANPTPPPVAAPKPMEVTVPPQAELAPTPPPPMAVPPAASPVVTSQATAAPAAPAITPESPIPLVPPPAMATQAEPTPPAPAPLNAARQQLLQDIYRANPNVVRFHQMAKEGRMDDVSELVLGRLLIAKAGSADHVALLKTLLLDPSSDSRTTLAVQRQAPRTLVPDEIIPLLEVISGPDSPNAASAREIAELVSQLHSTQLNSQQRGVLQNILTKP